MSKAFKKDDTADDGPEPQLRHTEGINYITPAGFKRLTAEFRQLKNTDRPEVARVVEWAAGNGDRSENADYQYGKRRLREIDRRLEYLSKQIERAKVIDPAGIKSNKIVFGATVSLEYEDGAERVFSIVGVDEIDAEKGRISWRSPLAAAITNHEAGDSIEFHSPRGVQELNITKIEYIKIYD